MTFLNIRHILRNVILIIYVLRVIAVQYPVKMNVNNIKEITLNEEGLESQYVPMREKIHIICPFKYPYWYHNGNILYVNQSLIAFRMTVEREGMYSCTPRNNNVKWANVTLVSGESEISSGNEASNIVNKATSHPSKSITRIPGDNVTISCLPPIPTVVNTTWWLNKSEIDVFVPKVKIKKLALYISDIDTTDSGLYTCQQCNITYCIRRSTVLIIIPKKLAIAGLHNKTVNVGDNAVFQCNVVSDLEYNVTWLKHNIDLDRTRNVFHLLKNDNVKQMISQSEEPHILKLGSVQEEDEGWYTCIAANEIGQASYSAYLTISKSKEVVELNSSKDVATDSVPILNTLNLEQHDNDESSDHEIEYENKPTYGNVERPPEFKNTNKLIHQLHKPSGSSLQLLCPATGNPMPNITWTRNDTKIERHIGKVNYKKWSIQMDDAITKDSGVYKCRICNSLGCIEHATKITIFDRLRSKPIISDKFPQNQTVLINNNASLECRVVSDLEPYIVWLKYSRKNESIEELEKLVQNFDKKPTNTSDVVVLERDPDKPNILSFPNATHDDEGWYSCVAASSLGQTVASAYLKVVDKLPHRDGLQRSHPAWITTVGIVVVLLFLLGTVFIIYVLRNLKHEKVLKQRIETVHQWTKKVIIYKPPSSEGSSCDFQMPVIKIEKQRTTFTTSTNSDPTQGFNEYEFPLDSNWEINRNQLTLGSTLGEGAFGRVVMAQGSGFVHGSSSAGTATTIVAVKMVKEEHTDADMASLVREMEVMKMIGKHINIINLLGCCSQNGPLWVIVEYAPHGNLKDFLKKNRPLSAWGSCSLKRSSEYLQEKTMLTEKHLTSFAFQIARGMEYLASRRCIHRDLAARNVLVSDDYIMKIADFGLARDIQDTDYYRKNTNGRLPIKWMAPESLQEKFYDSQSDVWSFGILLWEIMTYGEQPYPNVMSAEELYSYLITGQRMEKPPRCSLNIYMLMRQCWHFDSSARPTFSEIVENLDKILQLSSATSNEEYLDLSMPMLETPPSSDDESGTETFLESPSNRYQYTYKFN
ncbi:breathless [Haematobia irritans]|uniref:breathless n=1 Tax=Haematobia irritans TaxID=7368 RepID=UPI003F50719E